MTLEALTGVGLLLLAAGPVRAQQEAICFAFESGSDGWNWTPPNEVAWSASGGNPGGYLRFVDATGNATWVNMPTAVLGDWRHLEGGLISYDHRIFSTGSIVAIGPYHLELSGPGGVFVAESPAALGPTQWKTIPTLLIEDSWTKVSGSWDAVLANVTSVRIRMEHVNDSGGSNVEGIDNVCIYPKCSGLGTLPNGLVGYWPFDDGTASDRSGFGNHGQLFGVPSFAPGIVGKALELDGVDDFVEVADAASLNPSNAITLAAWWKSASFVGSGNEPIIDKGFTSHTPPWYQYHLGVVGDAYTNGYGRFNFSVAAASGGFTTTPGNGIWAPGEWYHVVATYDGGSARLYLNGRLTSEVAVTGLIQQFGRSLRMGKYSNLNRYLPGALDEVRIYNRALNAIEVASLYQYADGRCPCTEIGNASEWPVRVGGNGHFYEVVSVDAGITWFDANRAAIARGGYLATILSASENQFVLELVKAAPQSFFYVPAPATVQGTFGPWLGGFQDDEGAEPDGGWEWISGESLSFLNWLPGAPNDCVAACYGADEDGLHYFATGPSLAGGWNDFGRVLPLHGFVIEYDYYPVESLISSSSHCAGLRVDDGLNEFVSAANVGHPPYNGSEWAAADAVSRHSDLHSRSEFCCGDGSTFTYMAGEADDFQCPVEVASTNPFIDAALQNPTINFDLIPGRGRCCQGGQCPDGSSCSADERCPDNPVPHEVHVAHTFTDLPACAHGGQLKLKLRAAPGQATETDFIRLGFAGAGGLNTQWQRHIGRQLPDYGLFNSNEWTPNSEAEITLDLTRLPLIAGEAEGCTTNWVQDPEHCTLNLIEEILAHRFLDVIVSDDTGVDYMELTLTQDTDFTEEPYVDSTEYLDCADEVTLNNCDSAWYRFTFDFDPWCLSLMEGDLSCNVRNVRLTGTANVSPQGIAYLNGNRISGLMNNPGCDPDPERGPTDPCYALQDTGKDLTDVHGRRILTEPTPDPFGSDDPDGTSHPEFFQRGENELIFGVVAEASFHRPTGLEFKANVTYDLLGDCELDGDLDINDVKEFEKVMTGPKIDRE